MIYKLPKLLRTERYIKVVHIFPITHKSTLFTSTKKHFHKKHPINPLAIDIHYILTIKNGFILRGPKKNNPFQIAIREPSHRYFDALFGIAEVRNNLFFYEVGIKYGYHLFAVFIKIFLIY